MRSMDLFSGIGGLALGVARAGFHHEALVEWHNGACRILRRNADMFPGPLGEHAIREVDIREMDYTLFGPGMALLCAGPPCQPFSIAGLGRCHDDERNMFPEVFRAVRELLPKAILIENVRGLTSDRFSEYLQFILLQIAHPEVEMESDGHWLSHLERLRVHQKSPSAEESVRYRVHWRMLNAADYGVPQCRYRLFIVAFREGVADDWSFPARTHSLDALVWHQDVTGQYWRRHGATPRRVDRTTSPISRSRASKMSEPQEQPWVTVRDALCDLHEWGRRSDWAKAYPGHTGSDPDMPAKTLKAGVHGVPGGENCVRLADRRLRYFSVREMARLQTFPDGYEFLGSWSACARHLGNAVTVRLARVLAESIHAALIKGASSQCGSESQQNQQERAVPAGHLS